MAGSQLQKLGSIMERLKGLIETKAIDAKNIPFWYYIYERYPPTVNPVYDQPVEMVPITPIFYPEDNFRAQIHASQTKVIVDLQSMQDKNVISKCMELVKKGYSMEKAIKQSHVFLLQKGSHIENSNKRDTI